MFFDLLPQGSEVFLGASVTLETLGISGGDDKSGRFDALRPKMFAMDRATQGREIRKLGGSPDFAARKCSCHYRGWTHYDRFQDRQPAGSLCLRRR